MSSQIHITVKVENEEDDKQNQYRRNCFPSGLLKGCMSSTGLQWIISLQKLLQNWLYGGGALGTGG